MRRTQQIDTALLVVRLVTGLTMFLHGWQKLTTAGFGGVGDMFAEMGVPLAAVAGPVVMLVELVGGVLFMLGLLGVGLAFMLGIGTRVAAVSAAAMYTLMYLAAFPMSTNPLYDTHLLLAVAVLAMAGLAAGDHIGLGRQWSRLVKGNRFLI